MSVPASPTRADRPVEHADVAIVGAGMTGLRAAHLLVAAGRSVIVLDKGRRHGGRMATRRVDDATFDTGATAFSGHSADFRTALEGWTRAGHAHALLPKGGKAPGTWRGAPIMRSLPAALAATLDDGPWRGQVQLATEVTELARDPLGWRIGFLHTQSPHVMTASALIVTAPAPQSRRLLTRERHAATGAVPAVDRALASTRTLELLAAVEYVPSLTVLARPVDRKVQPDGSGALASDTTGFVGPGTSAPDLVRIHHNDRTGASAVVAVTLQASPEFSAAHLDGDRTAAALILTAQASTVTDVPLEVVHVHGWRFAQVRTGIDLGAEPPALIDTSSGAPLVLAGDCFGPSVTNIDPNVAATSLASVERAFTSGSAAARLLLA